jgi:hypothetical protein
MPPKDNKGKGPSDSGRKPRRPRVVVCHSPHSATCPPPQSQVHHMSMDSTMPFTPLLSSQTPLQFSSGSPSFISPSGAPSFVSPPGLPFQQTQVPSSFQHSFPFPTPIPSFMQPGGSSTPLPTQVPLSVQHPGGSTSSRPTQTARTPHPTHVPASDDHAESADDDLGVDGDGDQIDERDLRGDDDPSEIHTIDGRFWVWPEGNS